MADSDGDPIERQINQGQDDADGLGNAESAPETTVSRDLEVVAEETEIIDPDVLLAEIDQRVDRTLHSFLVEFNRGTDQTMSPAQIAAISNASPDVRASLIKNFDKTVDATIESQRAGNELRRKDQNDGVRLIWGGLLLALIVELGLIGLAFLTRSDSSGLAFAALLPVIGTVVGGLFVLLRGRGVTPPPPVSPDSDKRGPPALGEASQ